MHPLQQHNEQRQKDLESMRTIFYQVDYNNTPSGRWIAGTKWCIKFRFGCINSLAVARGCSGPNCRGMEHEVSFTWSVVSGKRRIVLNDTTEIYYSVVPSGPQHHLSNPSLLVQILRGNTLYSAHDTSYDDSETNGPYSKFETTWTMIIADRRHIFHLIAYPTIPVQTINGFRQFNLQIDGRSFFDLPRIFQLGNYDDDQSRVNATLTWKNEFYKINHDDDVEEKDEHVLWNQSAATLVTSTRDNAPKDDYDDTVGFEGQIQRSKQFLSSSISDFTEKGSIGRLSSKNIAYIDTQLETIELSKNYRMKIKDDNNDSYRNIKSQSIVDDENSLI